MVNERDRAVLEFEGSWWLYPGPKDRAVRDYLGISATRYYQILRRLIDDDEAKAMSPLVIRRLRTVRDKRRRQARDVVGKGDRNTR